MGPGAVRVFISHTAEHKVKATDLKARLGQFGIASFVAHEDIKPMQVWLSEIERALSNMDILVALITKDFNGSEWTDQEVGFALGCGVPIIPVRLEKDPYGFMGKYQAISESKRNSYSIAEQVFGYVLGAPDLKSSATDAYVLALKGSHSFDWSNYLAKFLNDIDGLSTEQEKALVDAFNDNSEVNRAFKFNPEIVEQLKRITGHDYFITGRRLALSPF